MKTIDNPLRLAVGHDRAIDSAGEWDRAVTAVLRRLKHPVQNPAGTWDALATKSLEGLTIPPLGTADRTTGRALPVALPVRESSGWDVRVGVFDADPTVVAAAALAELETGARSLWVTVGGSGVAPDELAAALTGVLFDLAPVVVSAAGAVTDRQAARRLAEVLRVASGVADGTNLGADPVGAAVRGGRARSAVTDEITDIASLASDLGVLGFAVDGRVGHDAGAGDAAELGYALAAGVHYLRVLEAAGLDVDDALQLLEFRFAVTNDQFTSIAKLRAARVLWARIAHLAGAAAPGSMRIHAVTSLPMTTRYDPWVNLLRTTVAAFAAGVGGADAVTVLPFDVRLGVPDAFGRRMARNISALLIEESHAAAVADPSAGAYAIEMLTHEMAEAAWAQFLAIDGAGGVLGALRDGSLRAGWAGTAARRRGQVATRRRPLTGVSEFPNPAETLPVRAPWPDPPEAASWSMDFEAMRDDPPAEAAFLATLGTVAEHSARAGFVTNLLAAGGVAARPAGRTETVEEVLTSYDGERVVVVVGTDTAYADWGAKLITALRSGGAETIILAGRPVPAVAGLIDDHVADGQDVVEFLHRVRGPLMREAAQA